MAGRLLALNGMRLHALSVLAFVSCSGGSDNSDAAPAGPSFVIDSPADGSIIGGTIWFSVSPSNPDDIASVAFNAGGQDLGADTTSADGFRVYVDAKTFPADALALTATATGKNGGTSTQRIVVTNVPHPSSTATVGASGAVLGTQETNGSLSTLIIPPGAADGATVTFTARTKAEVKAATGVDYDALGVTFLGAQDFTSSVPIEAPLAVSSGGFGPMVQPGHIVVQYAIQPDADGDGIGELVVVNTASVAPDGDVISDPVPLVTAQPGMTGGVAGAESASRPAPPTPSTGPPGTPIQFNVTGFSVSSVRGTCADWVCSDGSTQSVCGSASGIGAQAFDTAIPACPPGPARVTLRNVGTGRSFGPFVVVVTAGTPVADPLASLRNGLTDIGDLGNALPDTGDPAPDQAKEDLGDRPRDSKPDLDDAGNNPDQKWKDAMKDSGSILDNPDLDPPPLPHGAMPCLTDPEVAFLEQRRAAFAVVFARLSLAEGVSGASDKFIGDVQEIIFTITRVLELYPRCKPETCGMGSFQATGSTSASGSACPATPCSPSPTAKGGTFGMGSLPAAIGGFACGSVNPPGPSRAPAARLAAAGTFGEIDPGRFLVRIASNGSAVQFSGTTDAAGYFFVPAVPAGQPFTAVALDKVTGQTREIQGVGPSFPDSIHLLFDFWDNQGPGEPLAFNTNTSGTLMGLGLFGFSGTAGQVMTAAALVDQPAGPNNLNEQTVRIYDPDGVLVNSAACYHGTAGPGYDYAASCPLTLPKTGAYRIELKSTMFDPQAFILGLALTQDPAPIVVGPPVTTISGAISVLGDWQYFRFSGSKDDQLKLALDQTSSSLDIRVILRPLAGAGTVVAASTSPPSPTALTPRFALPETGDYVVEVMANWPSGERLLKDGFQGPYAITLLEPAVQNVALDSNTPSTLTAPVFDVFAFPGSAGQVLNIALLNPDRMTINANLYGPGGGNPVKGVNAGTGLLQTDLFRLPDTGTYRITVDPVPGSSGSTTLGLPLVEPPAALDVSMLPAQASGELLVVGDRRFFRFTGNQGDVRNFILGHASGTLNATLRLLRDTGTEFWTGAQLRTATTSALVRTAQTGNFALPQTGAYIIEVRPTGFDVSVLGVFDVTVAGP